MGVQELFFKPVVEDLIKAYPDITDDKFSNILRMGRAIQWRKLKSRFYGASLLLLRHLVKSNILDLSSENIKNIIKFQNKDLKGISLQQWKD